MVILGFIIIVAVMSLVTWLGWLVVRANDKARAKLIVESLKGLQQDVDAARAELEDLSDSLLPDQSSPASDQTLEVLHEPEPKRYDAIQAEPGHAVRPVGEVLADIDHIQAWLHSE